MPLHSDTFLIFSSSKRIRTSYELLMNWLALLKSLDFEVRVRGFRHDQAFEGHFAFRFSAISLFLVCTFFWSVASFELFLFDCYFSGCLRPRFPTGGFLFSCPTKFNFCFGAALFLADYAKSLFLHGEPVTSMASLYLSSGWGSTKICGTGLMSSGETGFTLTVAVCLTTINLN